MVRRRAIATLSCAKVIWGKNAADERNDSDPKAAAFTEAVDIPPAVARIRDRFCKTQFGNCHTRILGRGGAHGCRIIHRGCTGPLSGVVCQINITLKTVILI